MPAVEISVVLPVFNEEGNLAPLLAEISEVLRAAGRPFEVIAVDDASTDGSVAALRALQARHPELRVLRHRVNCGQSAAYAAGFARARGEVDFAGAIGLLVEGIIQSPQFFFRTELGDQKGDARPTAHRPR